MQLESYGIDAQVFDPIALEEPKNLPDCIRFIDAESLQSRSYDGAFVAVAHDCFKNMDLHSLLKSHSVLYDFKGIYKDRYDYKIIRN